MSGGFVPDVTECETWDNTIKLGGRLGPREGKGARSGTFRWYDRHMPSALVREATTVLPGAAIQGACRLELVPGVMAVPVALSQYQGKNH